MSRPSNLRELSIDKNDGLQMDAIVASPVSPSQLSGEHSPGPPPSPGQFKAPEIALSLTVIEGERFAAISQADYVTHIGGANSKRIESVIKVNNRLVNWVKKKVLGSAGFFFFQETLGKKFLVVAPRTCRSAQ